MVEHRVAARAPGALDREHDERRAGPGQARRRQPLHLPRPLDAAADEPEDLARVEHGQKRHAQRHEARHFPNHARLLDLLDPPLLADC